MPLIISLSIRMISSSFLHGIFVIYLQFSVLLPRSCPGVGLGGAGGGGGESKTLAWGFAMAPHRLRALVSLLKQ